MSKVAQDSQSFQHIANFCPDLIGGMIFASVTTTLREQLYKQVALSQFFKFVTMALLLYCSFTLFIRNSYCCRLPGLASLAHPASGNHQRCLTYEHWAGLSPYTSSFDFAETCVFDKQSLGVVSCVPFSLHEREGHLPKVRPAVLPSSLRKVLPLALVH